ncbi:MAG: hypothetical protein ACF8R7_16830 [Phycisphaerales bacterium JB039]
MMRPATFMVAASTALGACAAPGPLSPLQSDQTLRENLAANFEPGMTGDEVKQRLAELEAPTNFHWWYPATDERGRVLLVRHFKGGFWVESGHDWVNWLDISFVFDADDRLVRTATFRDELRYYDGEPVGAPRREPMRWIHRYPSPPPPPKDPLEGTS